MQSNLQQSKHGCPTFATLGILIPPSLMPRSHLAGVANVASRSAAEIKMPALERLRDAYTILSILTVL